MRFEADAVCRACAGTGLYVGLGERDGAAVVCHVCKGGGCERITIDYEPFVRRAAREGVTRVYRANPGICIGERAGVCGLEDFGGMPFADWLDGKPWPAKSEDRAHTCPAWFWQTADYKRRPNWDECDLGVRFSDCRHFAEKAKCWERFDREQAVAP